MKTIRVNLKGDIITKERAAAEAGINFVAVSRRLPKEKTGVVKVVLSSRGGVGERMQETWYCAPVIVSVPGFIKTTNK